MASSKKHQPDHNGFVFSTNPNFKFEAEPEAIETTLPPQKQVLRVRLDTKQRGGKAVTLITGFVGTDADIEQLGKQLKNYCGTGGSVKDGEMMVQGDQRDKVLQWLLKNGYQQTKKV